MQNRPFLLPDTQCRVLCHICIFLPRVALPPNFLPPPDFIPRIFASDWHSRPSGANFSGVGRAARRGAEEEGVCIHVRTLALLRDQGVEGRGERGEGRPRVKQDSGGYFCPQFELGGECLSGSFWSEARGTGTQAHSGH